MISEAQAKADALRSEAEQKSANLVRDAETRHRDVLGQLATRQKTIESRIVALRGFETDYRSGLYAHLRSRIDDLDHLGEMEPEGAPRIDAAAAGGAGSAEHELVASASNGSGAADVEAAASGAGDHDSRH